MKTIEQAEKEFEIARAQMNRARSHLNNLIASQERARLNTAKTKAKFRIGDIIRYYDRRPPILITAIECYSSGEPTYRGLQVCGGKLTRSVRSTEGYGTQDPYVNGLGQREPERDWIKVGDCTELKKPE